MLNNNRKIDYWIIPSFSISFLRNWLPYRNCKCCVARINYSGRSPLDRVTQAVRLHDESGAVGWVWGVHGCGHQRL